MNHNQSFINRESNHQPKTLKLKNLGTFLDRKIQRISDFLWSNKIPGTLNNLQEFPEVTGPAVTHKCVLTAKSRQLVMLVL